MKLFIDIGHPAHVHYLKHFIWHMQEEGHTFTIVSRDKDIALQLLDYYKLPYINRGKGKNGLLGKFIYMFQADLFLLRQAMKVKPDMFISMGSIYAAQTAWLMRKPHIAFDDTDHNFFQHAMYIPFTKVLLTPKVFQKDFGKKHFRFDGFLELGGLHPNRFKAQSGTIQELLRESLNKRYVILRFVSWAATHDIGLKGLSLADKYALVKELSKHARVIISSEEVLPDDLMQYSYRVHPALMHDVLNGACLLVSESLTMAAEAAFLGTPSLCISTAQAGTLDEEVKLGLIELYRSGEGLVERAIEIVREEAYKSAFKAKSLAVVKNKVDLTAFLAWFVKNYPGSGEVMEQNPDYADSFK